MLETLVPLDLPPGYYNTGTTYQSKGRWMRGDCVRFSRGSRQPIGGWSQRTLTGSAIVGTPSHAISWVGLTGARWIAVGTSRGLWVIDSNNVAYDIMATGGANIPYASVVAGSFPGLVWHLELFGGYLVGHQTVNLGPGLGVSTVDICIWAGNTATRASAHGSSGFGASAPSIPWAPAVTTPERFLVFLGTEATHRRAQWASQETFTDWTAAATNSAGDFDLETPGELVCGEKAPGQTLLWTTVDLWTMTYVGGDLIYSFAKKGDNCGIISDRAKVVLDSGAYWMGYDKFFLYDGFVKEIPCEVHDYVFGSLNRSYRYKVWALANPLFDEITWFYPSGAATEIDRYVTFNYTERHWTFGSLARNAGVTQQAGAENPVPVLFNSSAAIFDHETGNTRTGITPYVESGPIELGNGDNVMRLQQIVPDDETQGDVTLSLVTSMFPNGAETTNGPYTAANPTAVRLTARQVRLKATEAAASAWRLGVPRLGVIPGGRR